MTAGKYMQTNPMTVKVEDCFGKVVDKLCRQRGHSVIVVDHNDEIAGIVSRNRAFRLLGNGTPFDTCVEQIMEKDVMFISPDTPIDKLIEWSVSSLPVVENKKVVGVIALTDTINAYNYTMLSLQDELKATINSVYNAIISIDNNGNIRTVNSAAKMLFDIRDEDSMQAEDVVGRDYLLSILETGEPIVNKKIDYKEKTLLFTGTPIVEKDEKIKGAVAVFNDYTGLVQLYKQLFKEREKKDELTAIFESSFDGLVVTDNTGKIVESNKAFLNLIKKESHEIEGLSIGQLEDESLRETLLDLIYKGERATSSCALSNGLKLLISSSPMKNDKGEKCGVVANVKNVTEIKELENKLYSLNKLYREQVAKDDIFSRYVFNSPKSKKLIDRVLKVAAADSTVLITGESGVGKEIIANLIYQNSERNKRVFAKINCAAIPEALIEAELFGYEPGAFTGADKRGRRGLFESANGGVVLLDEVGDLPLDMQAKLLRVLQGGEFFRVGGTKPVKVDVRVISATNRNLEELVEQGKFRSDLYYRLNVVPIEVLPLRERKEDLLELIDINLKRFNQKYKKNKTLSKQILDKMQAYDWPGNVRELENVIERVVVFGEEDIVDYYVINPGAKNQKIPQVQGEFLDGSKTYKELVADYERILLTEALEKYRTTRTAGEKLGLDQSTIVKKAQKLNIRIK